MCFFPVNYIVGHANICFSVWLNSVYIESWPDFAFAKMEVVNEQGSQGLVSQPIDEWAQAAGQNQDKQIVQVFRRSLCYS